LAVIVLGGVYALIAIFSWARWILNPSYLYVLTAIVLVVYLVALVYPILIAARGPDEPRKPYNKWWFYLAWVVANGLFAEAFLGNRGVILGYETYRIPSASMAPTLQPRDFVTADTWRYREEAPRPGDIVVYEEVPGSGLMYIKRIVGVPGDRIEVRAGRLFRNREQSPEAYLESSLRVGGADFPPMVLGLDEYFVLGDNRNNSRDSRYHGPVPIDQIYGRVESIWLSFAGSGRFPARFRYGTHPRD
jgi:signal peptidase I